MQAVAGILWIVCQGGLVQDHRPGGTVLDRPVPPENEPVMTSGMRITAKTDFGDIAIAAGEGLKRSFSWNGGIRSIEMWPREGRWFGSYGLYFPGPGNHWLAHDGITRCVAQEGQLNFGSKHKAMAWLKMHTPGGTARLYRNDGLTLWVVRSANTLEIDIFQIYIRGVKPSGLWGADDDRITVAAKTQIPERTRAIQKNPVNR